MEKDFCRPFASLPHRIGNKKTVYLAQTFDNYSALSYDPCDGRANLGTD